MNNNEIDKLLINFISEDWIKDESGNYIYKKDHNLILEKKVYNDIKKSITINDTHKNPKTEEVIVKYDGVDIFERIILTIDDGKTILPLVENAEEFNVDIKLSL